MPTKHYQRVKTFMENAGQDTPTKVVIPDATTRLLRARLILEEALETVQALGVSVRLADQEVTMESCNFLPDRSVDLEGVADGCADISVVTIGTLVAFGIDDEKLLREVDEANLRKFGPGSFVREDGKWMKPPDWVPPDIAGVLNSQ
ncbi:MAG: hypothetical protein OXE92_04165 [Bacteroidetes bacterium]|nr:hypothetical protein [Bacteroidota bacterium]MCY4204904.1 hypothetical protein [Bacteroidota bacterium]